MEIQIQGNKIYCPLIDKWLITTPEERVRQTYISRLVNKYQYDLKQMGQEITVANGHRGQGKARADIVIWKSQSDKLSLKSPLIVIECKAENVTIHEEDYYQGYNYASWAGADFFVTTNQKETRVFRVVKGHIPKRLEEIVDIPKASDNEKKIKELLTQTKAFTRDEFSKLLFTCHNIIRNNDKLSPEAAFDEISKILFIKIRYERNNTGAQIFSKEEFKKLKSAYEAIQSKDSRPFYQQLFENTKDDFSKDDLFDSNDTIKIKEASFEAIVEKLQVYNLSNTADDVKGIAFEKFLGRTFRGELGQFFTPRTIVNFIIDILDPQEGEVICDPCCGSGGFLIRAFEYIREKIELDIQSAKNKLKEKFLGDSFDTMTDRQKEKVSEQLAFYLNQLNTELDTQNEGSRAYSLSHDCIFGTDANPRMARTAKMNMIMHGDGHGGVHHHDGLLNVNGVFENRFDVILTNPPFGSRVEKSLLVTEADRFTDQKKIDYYIKRYGEDYTNAMKQVTDNIGKPILNLYTSGNLSGLTEVLFIERCIRLLKPGGRLGIVLPEGVLNNTNLQSVRELFEGMAKILLITSIPQDVFMASGATVKPSLLFFKKFTNEERVQFDTIKQTATEEIENKYRAQLDIIDSFLSVRGNSAAEKKVKRAEKRSLKSKMEAEVWSLIKERFDYTIPIAQVQKAGITTTGAACENELIDLVKEFTPYRKEHNMWTSKELKFQYEVIGGKIVRIDQDGNKKEL